MGRTFHIHAGWLIDGSGGKALSQQLIFVKDDKVESIRKWSGARVPKGNLIDYTQCTILPGLIDSHVHLFMSGTDEREVREAQLNASFERIKPVIVKHVKAQVRNGVVAVRDGGDRNAHTLRYKNECLGKTQHPLLIHTAGRAWYKPNRYGRLIGRTPKAHETLADAIRADAERKDHLKIVNSGLNSLIRFGRQTPPQFGFEEMEVAVQASNRKGWPVMVHANGEIPVDIAIRAGCGSIEHGFFMGEDNLKKLAERRIFWIPTAFTMKAFSDHFDSGNLPTDVPHRNLEHQLEQMAAAKRLGIKIALGTDAGSLGVHHGSGVVAELMLLMEAGFSVTEAIQCATGNGAELLGLDGLGLIKPGSLATFLVVPGTPAHLPYSLHSIHELYINGRTYGGIPGLLI